MYVRCLAECRQAIHERLEGGVEPFFCHSDEEGVLTQRLEAPHLPPVIVAIANKGAAQQQRRESTGALAMSADAVARALKGVRVLLARSLRTQLFLRPRPGDVTGEEVNVSSQCASEVLYFVDTDTPTLPHPPTHTATATATATQSKSEGEGLSLSGGGGETRIILSATLPAALDVYTVLAMAVNQLLGGCMTEQLLALAVALRSEGTEVDSALGTLGISVHHSEHDSALERRGHAGAEVLALDRASLCVQVLSICPPLRILATIYVSAYTDAALLCAAAPPLCRGRGGGVAGR
jgi:hypothetical protein